MYPQINKTESPIPLAKILTNFGEILVELFPKDAPKAVENFTKLSRKGYYDGTIFHRVIKDFMIQGGDPTGTGMGGQSIWQTPFEDEFSNELFNFRGALSMANAGPNTNGSQFFIVQNKNLPSQMEEQLRQANYPQEIIQAYLKGGTPWLDHHHTVFGQVRSGMDVIDEIANLQTENDHPIKEVAIKKISILNK